MSEEKNCCCYENGKCLWAKRYYENSIVPDCEKVKDCYYKQLKRLQAENEEVKKENKETLHYLACMTEQRNKLKLALEEIREYLQQFKKKKSNFYTLNDVVTDIASNIEKIISEVLK